MLTALSKLCSVAMCMNSLMPMLLNSSMPSSWGCRCARGVSRRRWCSGTSSARCGNVLVDVDGFELVVLGGDVHALADADALELVDVVAVRDVDVLEVFLGDVGVAALVVLDVE
eukprot:3686136-Amphidinium_carterae.1